MSTATLPGSEPAEFFRHEAFLYTGDEEFLAGAASFIRDGLAGDEPILVVVGAEKIERLRAALGDEASAVHFTDMADIGRNPARIIPAWRDFVDDHTAGGRRVRGIGEPIWPSRSPAEVDECQRHESLLNVAFADTPAWWLLCPYDIGALAPAVIDEAYRNHPFVRREAGPAAQTAAAAVAPTPFDDPLPAPLYPPSEIGFDSVRLGGLRQFVGRRAAAAGLGPARVGDVVLAVNEVAANSLRHGGGRGTLRVWQEADAFLCEVEDGGRIGQPLVGRERPARDSDNGRGLWLVNQVCDLVQLRSSSAGTVVRLHMRRSPAA